MTMIDCVALGAVLLAALGAARFVAGRRKGSKGCRGGASSCGGCPYGGVCGKKRSPK